jgi:Asp-tRNA(Asn)/Glu-tRNA(Gln) amidotransferase A subunit family amidase
MKNDKTLPINNSHLAMNRRRFVEIFGAMGLGSTLLPGALAAIAQDAAEITSEMVNAALKVAGLEFSEEEINSITRSLNGRNSFVNRYRQMRDMNIANGDQPAIVFNPLPAGYTPPTARQPMRRSDIQVDMPQSDEELAFLPVTHLSKLIETRQISSTELTKFYLSRLKKYDPVLFCVVTLTEELALKQAQKADEELAAGIYRGPLHGIPWGAKDLFAVKGYRTTFGASPYKDQIIDTDSTVFTRLSEAGAVLVAKLTLGALAQGDRWFGGMTRNPWNPEQGSSGSSAGPGSATAGGLVGFGIGTETQGSIISPSRRNGVTGLRPTFGRISRFGAMALSWTMDKVGPLCRSAEDCALVFNALYGPDGKDNSVIDVPFNWDAYGDVRKLRVGYLRNQYFRGEIPDNPENPERVAQQRTSRKRDDDALNALLSLGVDLKPIDLPSLPTGTIGFILSTEAAAAFSDLTLSNRDDLMNEAPERSSWGGSFRQHRLVPAVEYIQANRIRYRIIEQFNREVFSDIDMFIGSSLSLTNLTGHPEISFVHGFDERGMPTSMSITGKLFGEADMLLLVHAFQQKTGFNLRHPDLA